MSPLEVERVDGVPIAHVTEDIDAASAAMTQRQLAAALDPDALRLVVDLSATRYVDSAGIDICCGSATASTIAAPSSCW